MSTNATGTASAPASGARSAGSAARSRFQPLAVSGFAALTLLIWTNRIWLAWTNPDDSVAEKIGWSTPITVFWLSAVAILVMQQRGAGKTKAFGIVLRVFAGGTVVYWAIRIAVIMAGDWAVGFKVVHAVLGVVSAVAAVLAWRAQSRVEVP